MNEFVNPWFACPSCHQNYQNELGIDIATKFVSFVRRKYPDNTRRQVVTLDLKLRALNSMFERLEPVQKRELGVTATVLLSLIDRMKGDAPIPIQYSHFEADAYYAHGRIALVEGTEESARRAEVHFENQLEVFEAIGDAARIATAKSNIVAAKSIYEGGSAEEVQMKVSQEMYELRIAEWGEENEYTINAGKNYADILQKFNRQDEAMELLTKLLATSKQVFGPDHITELVFIFPRAELPSSTCDS
jgi:hypothetical protein